MPAENKRFSRMLHLTINVTNPFWPRDEVEAQLNTADDWIRYAGSSYMFWTDRSAQEWHGQFRDTLPALRQYQYLICAVDLSDKQGLLSKEAWDWMNKYENVYRNILMEMLGGSDKPQIKRRSLADIGQPPPLKPDFK